MLERGVKAVVPVANETLSPKLQTSGHHLRSAVSRYVGGGGSEQSWDDCMGFNLTESEADPWISLDTYEDYLTA